MTDLNSTSHLAADIASPAATTSQRPAWNTPSIEIFETDEAQNATGVGGDAGIYS